MSLYVVLSLNKSIEVSVYGQNRSLPLSYADGMVGALPVFGSRKEAEAFALGRDVMEIAEVVPPNRASKSKRTTVRSKRATQR